MSPIRTFFALALSMLSVVYLLALAGCGDNNSGSFYDPDTGAHPAGWLPSGHAGPGQAHQQSCTECHGTDLNGGISGVSCRTCHGWWPANTPGLVVAPNQIAVHPWGALTYALHGPYVRQNGTTACANGSCHGTQLQGAAGPSCTACHLGGTLRVHPAGWETDITLHGQFVLQNGTGSCRNAACHGPQLQGVFLSGPACSDCHSQAQIGAFPP